MIRVIIQIIVGMLITGFILAAGAVGAVLFVYLFDWIAYGGGFEIILLIGILIEFSIASYFIGGYILEKWGQNGRS